MGGYANDELHHRQGKMGDLEQARQSTLLGALGDGVGPATAGGTVGQPKWRLLLVPLLLILVGLFLLFTPWLPGLGAFLIVAAMIALPVILLQAWLGS
jgi:hypothetical protein